MIGIGSFLAWIGVGLGAFAAHGMKKYYSPEDLVIFETGIKYQMYHSFGLIILGILGNSKLRQEGKIFYIGMIMGIGIFLFSGSLYLIVFTGIRKFGMITPLGGTMFLIAWLWMSILMWKK